jgi:hypothetical protein
MGNLLHTSHTQLLTTGINKQTNKQTNSVALSPRANYTDWTTATCRRNLVSTFVDRRVSRGPGIPLKIISWHSKIKIGQDNYLLGTPNSETKIKTNFQQMYNIWKAHNLKNAVFWDVTSWASFKNRRFGRKYRVHHQSDKNQLVRNTEVFLRSILRLLITANIATSSPILVTLIMEEILSSETSFLTRPTRRNIAEDGILHSNRRKRLKPYIELSGWAM